MNKGFTLIELLIVMAIVGIVLAIALPEVIANGQLPMLLSLAMVVSVPCFISGCTAVLLTLKWAPGKKVLTKDDLWALFITFLQGPYSLYKAIRWKRSIDVKKGVKKPFQIRNPFYKENY